MYNTQNGYVRVDSVSTLNVTHVFDIVFHSSKLINYVETDYTICTKLQTPRPFREY